MGIGYVLDYERLCIRFNWWWHGDIWREYVIENIFYRICLREFILENMDKENMSEIICLRYINMKKSGDK
jgi:hypothetical protein